MSSPSAWTRQLDYLARDAFAQRSFMDWFQQVTGCSDTERDEILWERMDKARLALSVHMTATGKEEEKK